MIRILQQDNRLIKIIFAVIITVACVTMVITLVPGIFDNTGDSAGRTATMQPFANRAFLAGSQATTFL